MIDITYEPKEVAVIIDGNEYLLPERTEKLEKQLKSHDSKIRSVSQYDSDYDLVKIMLGMEAVKKIFPKGEDENLDRMHFITTKIVEAYYAEYRAIEEETYKETIEKLDEVTDKVSVLNAFSEKNVKHRK